MKEYIKPTINIQRVVVEQLLASNSEEGNIVEGHSKRNEFWPPEDESNEAFSISDGWD